MGKAIYLEDLENPKHPPIQKFFLCAGVTDLRLASQTDAWRG